MDDADAGRRNIGLVIRSARHAKGWTAEYAAERADVAPKTWSRAESGEHIRTGSWTKIEALLGLPAGTIVNALQQQAGWKRLADLLKVSPTITVTTPEGAENLHDLADVRVDSDGVQLGPPRHQVHDVTPEDARSMPYLVVDEMVPGYGGPDRTLAEASISVEGGTLTAAGVNDVVRWAPTFTLANSLASRLANNAANLTRAEQAWLQATVEVAREAALAKVAGGPGE